MRYYIVLEYDSENPEAPMMQDVHGLVAATQFDAAVREDQEEFLHDVLLPPEIDFMPVVAFIPEADLPPDLITMIRLCGHQTAAEYARARGLLPRRRAA